MAILVTIPRRTKLKSIVEYNQERYHFVDPNTDPKLIFTGWKGKTVKIAKFAVTTMAFLNKIINISDHANGHGDFKNGFH